MTILNGPGLPVWRGRAAMGLAGLMTAVVVLWALDALFPPDMGRYEARSTLVLDQRGQLLRPFPTREDTWRLPIERDGVDPLYLAMLEVVEDGRNAWHPGVDPLAILRASGQMLRYGRPVSGASTLDMQVARLLEPKSRTLGNKLREALRALQLRARLGRAGVRDIYLTLAPYGGTLEGVRAASLAWYGKEPTHLTPAEAALLVALPQSPERLRPDRHPEAAKKARDRVLQRVAEAGVIAPDVAAHALSEPVPRFQRAMPRLAPHLTERLASRAGVAAVIPSTLDGTLQAALESLGRAYLSGLTPGDDLAVVVLAHADARQGPRLIAHLGSADWHRCQLDLSQAVRSPGSTLKPFIYALAFDDLSVHPYTLIEDVPKSFGSWRPDNFDHAFHGVVTAREALQRSLNIPAVSVLERVGAARMSALLQQSGARLTLAGGVEPGLPLALGGVGIRLMDLAMLYAALDGQGRVRPVRMRADRPEEGAYRLVGEAAAYSVLDILQGSAVPAGVAARRALQESRRIAFKTGTSFGYRDAWTVGVSDDYTVAVWVGRPDGASMPGAMGLNSAAPLMFRVFDLLPPDRGTRRMPDNGNHALFQRQPPPALARLEMIDDAAARAARPRERLRILFPPDGAGVEPVDDGIALLAEGGKPPLRWLVNGVLLEEGAAFWHPDGDGFAEIVVLDDEGRRARTRIRVLGP
ncbi:MAG: penicillin-binding protein 1C [Pseudomonadota bacterium]